LGAECFYPETVRKLFGMLILGALASGCAGKKRPPAPTFSDPGAAMGFPKESQPHAAKLIVTPASTASGKVAMVNNSSRFVVLNYPLGHLPANNKHLNVYHNGLKVGEVKITGPQYDDNVVADLLSGECEAGDEARD